MSLLQVSRTNKSHLMFGQIQWCRSRHGSSRSIPFRIPTDMFYRLSKTLNWPQTVWTISPITMKKPGLFPCIRWKLAISLFKSIIINKPEACLKQVQQKKKKKRQDWESFVAVNAIRIILIEVKKILTTGKHALDIKGRVLAECAGMLKIFIILLVL